MAKISVSGSTLASDCRIEISAGKIFENISISLGVEELLSAFDDVLSDADMLDDELFEKIKVFAGQVQAISLLRDAEKKCLNCDDNIACANCEVFHSIK